MVEAETARVLTAIFTLDKATEFPDKTAKVFVTNFSFESVLVVGAVTDRVFNVVIPEITSVSLEVKVTMVLPPDVVVEPPVVVSVPVV